MTGRVDFAVVGGGIGGASVAAALAPHGRVVLLEMEDRPGRHATGRSAAMFAPAYGPAAVRALTRASAGFYASPPEGFADVPLLNPRAMLTIARPDQVETLDRHVEEMEGLVERLDGAATRACNPLLREGYAAAGALDATGADIDVDALHRGWLRMLRAAGGQVMTDAAVQHVERDGADWLIGTRAGTLRAGVVVNAAGAWADHVGALAGARPIGLVPKRRTAVIVAAPAGAEVAGLPLTVDADEAFYLKPDAGRLLLSPADETPVEPGDAFPEEEDMALAVARCEDAFAIEVRRIEASWAGLRSFVADKVPVAGPDPDLPGFHWLAAQGGYGIQCAPALAAITAALVLGRTPQTPVPLEALSPARLSRSGR